MHLPVGFKGLVVAGVLAAAMATLNSALNAIATVGLVITLLTLTLAFLVYRRFAGGKEAASLAALEV